MSCNSTNFLGSFYDLYSVLLRSVLWTVNPLHEWIGNGVLIVQLEFGFFDPIYSIAIRLNPVRLNLVSMDLAPNGLSNNRRRMDSITHRGTPPGSQFNSCCILPLTRVYWTLSKLSPKDRKAESQIDVHSWSRWRLNLRVTQRENSEGLAGNKKSY
jgi:hypothetical protein